MYICIIVIVLCTKILNIKINEVVTFPKKKNKKNRNYI